MSDGSNFYASNAIIIGLIDPSVYRTLGLKDPQSIGLSVYRAVTVGTPEECSTSDLCHILPISNPVILNFELFYCSATLSKFRSIGLDNFFKWQVQMSNWLDLLPLKLCGKEGRPQRPQLHRGHRNPASNIPPRCLIHWAMTLAVFTFRKTYRNVIRPFPELKAWF